jgi:hypothetical protein
MTLQSAENRDRRDWLSARCVKFCCEEYWSERNDSNWLIELRRRHKNDYWIWFDDLSFRRKFDWFENWSFRWCFIWDLNEMILRAFSWFKWQTRHDKWSRWDVAFDKCDSSRTLRAQRETLWEQAFFISWLIRVS